jgi:SM-20-related protein
MTPKEILDSFSQTLMQDERILSAQERSLLIMLLQHANAVSGGQTSDTRQAVRSLIASAIGETVAQRAFSVLGGSIVERILESTPVSSSVFNSLQSTQIYANEPQPPRSDEPQPPGVKAPTKPKHDHGSPGEPQPPGDEPQPPGVKAPTKPRREPTRDSPNEPQPPGADPQPPGVKAPVRQGQSSGRSVDTAAIAETQVEVVERQGSLPARCVVLEEFLAPQELEQLTAYALQHEADFRTSEVVLPEADRGVVNYEHRRSRVLMELGAQQELILERIRTVLPQVLESLAMENFSIASAEMQITASNDGDFFHFHSDSGSERVASRYLTFVYFFHHQPAGFEGGELRIHDARLEGARYVSEGSYQTIVPRQNQIVFFPCELMHEITPVKCPSGLFADSRFTLNGWLRR